MILAHCRVCGDAVQDGERCCYLLGGFVCADCVDRSSVIARAEAVLPPAFRTSVLRERRIGRFLERELTFGAAKTTERRGDECPGLV